MLQAKAMNHRGMMITGWSKKKGSLHIQTINYATPNNAVGLLTLTPVREDLIRVTMKEYPYPEEKKSLAVIQEVELANSPFNITEHEHYLEAKTPSLKIHISKKHCAISYYTLDDKPLLRETAEYSKLLKPVDVYRTHYASKPEAVVEESVDGVKMRAKEGTKVKQGTGYQATLSLSLAEEEAIYGLGQHEEGTLNYRSKYQFLYQENMKIAMPVLVSTRGYGLFWDTNALSTFDDTGDTTDITIDLCQKLEYYFIYGPEFDNVIEGMRFLTVTTL